MDIAIASLLAASPRQKEYFQADFVHFSEIHYWPIGCCLLERRNLPFVSASLVGLLAVMMGCFCRLLWLALQRIFAWFVDMSMAATAVDSDNDSSG